MTASWVAGSVRAHAIARRRLGFAAARQLAASPSLAAAVEVLRSSPYGREVAPGATLAQAQHGTAATVLWHLRILAGWLPSSGVRALRALAGWFELANVDQHLRALAGRPAEPPYRLGMLATAWPRLARATSPDQLRAELASSPWGDPGGSTERDIALGMRLAWADRVRGRVPAAAGWARGAAALLVARELVVTGRPLPTGASVAARRLLGRGLPAEVGGSVAELAGTLPPDAAGALREVARPDELWRAEIRWWIRLRTEGAALLSKAGFAPEPVVGAAAVLAADAWLVRAALELAARGGTAPEALDALA